METTLDRDYLTLFFYVLEAIVVILIMGTVTFFGVRTLRKKVIQTKDKLEISRQQQEEWFEKMQKKILNMEQDAQYLYKAVQSIGEQQAVHRSNNLESFTKIDQQLQFLVNKFSDLNIRMHVTEARLNPGKNVTINSEPTKGKPGRPKGYSPKRAKELAQK